jgi:hypothetical protein
MSWGDGSGVPTSGSDIVIVGVDHNGLLHIRIFDASGEEVTDTDETKLPATRAAAISALKQQIPGLLPPYVLSAAEKAEVVRDATSIVAQTRLYGRAQRHLPSKKPRQIPGNLTAGHAGYSCSGQCLIIELMFAHLGCDLGMM